jgi:uncharacterized membrane protein (UPF0127 family)
VQTVKLGGEWFHLEVAADDATRMRGLGGRTTIEPDGGMLFVLPELRETGFVMRDCPIDIDIIYLSAEGRVMTTYEMKAVEPRGEGEGQPGTFDNQKYESRLKSYPSHYPTQFVIELAPGTLKRLDGKLRQGDRVDLPYADLKKRLR